MARRQPLRDALVRVAIYVRISKDETGRALGVERQEAEVRVMLERHYGPGNYEVVEVYEDNNISAWKGAKRPAYERLLQDARARRFDVIGLYAADRLYRRMVDLEKIIAALGENPDDGVGLVVVTGGFVDLTTSNGRCNARIMAATAQQESDIKSERIRSQKEQAAAKGWATSRPTFGYARKFLGRHQGATLVPIDAEVATVVFLAGEILAGSSQGEAADAANSREMFNRGQLWTGNAVRKALVRPSIAGLSEHKGEVVGEGNWPAILPVETWKMVRAELTDPARKQSRKRAEYWLRGTLVNVDGVELRGGRAGRGTAKSPGHYDRRVYKGGTTIDAEAVEAFLAEMVARCLPHLSWEDEDVVAVVSPEAEAVRAVQAELDEIVAERAAGEITKAEYHKLRAGIVKRLEEAQAAVPARERRSAPRVKAGDLVKRWNLPVTKGGLSDLERRQIIRWSLGTVVIGPSPGGGKATAEHVGRRILSVSGPAGEILAAGDPGPRRRGRGRSSSRRALSA